MLRKQEFAMSSEPSTLESFETVEASPGSAFNVIDKRLQNCRMIIKKAVMLANQNGESNNNGPKINNAKKVVVYTNAIGPSLQNFQISKVQTGEKQYDCKLLLASTPVADNVVESIMDVQISAEEPNANDQLFELSADQADKAAPKPLVKKRKRIKKTVDITETDNKVIKTSPPETIQEWTEFIVHNKCVNTQIEYFKKQNAILTQKLEEQMKHNKLLINDTEHIENLYMDIRVANRAIKHRYNLQKISLRAQRLDETQTSQHIKMLMDAEHADLQERLAQYEQFEGSNIFSVMRNVYTRPQIRFLCRKGEHRWELYDLKRAYSFHALYDESYEYLLEHYKYPSPTVDELDTIKFDVK